MKNTIVSRTIFDTISHVVNEGAYRPAVESSPAQSVIILDLALIREVDHEAYDAVTEALVIEGDFRCEDVDRRNWLMVTWKEDESAS